MVYLRKLVRGLGESEPGPSSLATDSQSARSFSYKPEHHDRMKHVQRWRLATVIGSTAFEDLQRGVHFADEELLLVPDDMPFGAVGEFVE
jgi:hypothetical protein